MSNNNKSNKDRYGKTKITDHQRGLFGGSTSKSGLDANWNSVDPQVILQIIWAVDTLGGYVTFGTTRNNNAYSVKLFLGEPFDPRYFDGDDEGRITMREWADMLVAHAAESA